MTGDPASSERLLQVLATLPEKEPVAVVYRGDAVSDTLLIATYFAWPRPVHSLPVDLNNVANQMQVLRAARVRATFYCGLTPPSDTEPLVQIGNGLSMAPHPAAKDGTP